MRALHACKPKQSCVNTWWHGGARCALVCCQVIAGTDLAAHHAIMSKSQHSDQIWCSGHNCTQLAASPMMMRGLNSSGHPNNTADRSRQLLKHSRAVIEHQNLTHISYQKTQLARTCKPVARTRGRRAGARATTPLRPAGWRQTSRQTPCCRWRCQQAPRPSLHCTQPPGSVSAHGHPARHSHTRLPHTNTCGARLCMTLFLT